MSKIVSNYLHALSMVIKNKKKYMLLSVTILISFCFYLSYLIYVDSNYMTKHIEDIVSEDNIIRVCATDEEAFRKVYLLLDELEDMDDTKYYINREIHLHEDYMKLFIDVSYEDLNMAVSVVPSRGEDVFMSIYKNIRRIDGKDMVLGKDEVLVPEELYRSLKKNSEDKNNIYINLPFYAKNDKCIIKKMKVVSGYTSNKAKDDNMFRKLVISYDSIKNENIQYGYNSYVYIYTKYPTQIVEKIRNLDLAGISTMELKNDAFGVIREKITVKAIIAMVLFFLLGINLFSSFKNVLSERKYEIGVKRAIGASGTDIILQFFFEGVIVVFINILLSLIMTIVLFVFYKLYKQLYLGESFIIYINRYSVIMYLVVCMFMMTVYSVTFAIQSARVEIVKYLKSE